MLFHVFPPVYSPGQTNTWSKFNVNRKALSFWSFIASFEKKPFNSDFIHIFSLFLMFIHVWIAPGQKQTMPWGQNFDPNRNALSLWPFFANLKKNLFQLWYYTYFKIVLYTFIATGQGQTNPWGQNFDVNRKALSFWFYKYFLMFSCMYMAPGQEQTTPGWQSFYVNRKPRSLWPFVASFKMVSEFWLNTHFLIILYNHVYSPGARADKPLGSKFLCQQKALTTSTICCKFETKSLWILILYTFFNVFPYVYSPGQGQTTLCGQNSDVNRKALSLCPFVASFKNVSLKSDFIHIFACFYTCIKPWGRGRQPPGVRIFILTSTFCHSGHLL